MTDILSKHANFRGKPDEMAMLCAVLRQRGLYADALAMGLEAVAAAPDSNAVRAAVSTALSSGVAKFHLPMLRDNARNRAYARAIERAVRPGMRVLEIGTGAGLLAMIAARAGAEVVTCEENPMIAAAAVDIIGRNGLSDRIRVIPKRSDRLTIPEDLSEPADLVIHEIFGAGLFDEGVTAAMTDARLRLLKPGAPSVPPGARVRCMLVREGRSKRPQSLRNVEGFDLSPFELLGRHMMSASAYWTRGLEPASIPHSALAMDYDAPPPFGPAHETIEVTSLGGRVDGLAQWIAIDFGDGEVLENDPFNGGRSSSWGARYMPLVTPVESAPGDRFDIQVRHRNAMLLADIVPRAVPDRQGIAR